jgi:ribosomal protein S18 acetylase RimI-like enzyme
MSTSLRPTQPEDEPFLFEVYAGTRADEMALVSWPTEQKYAFLQMQSNAQRQSYTQQFPAAQWNIVLRDAESIGRLIVDQADDAIHLLDIALLPEYRNAGIGTLLIQNLLDEAAQINKPVQLHVDKNNRAQRLYDRLGFRVIGDTGIYFSMEWRPGDNGS